MPATLTGHTRPSVGCRSFLLIGQGYCVSGALCACKTADTTACSTSVSHSIPNARAVGRSGPQRAQFGMPASEAAYRNAPPWIDWRGCCRTDDIWTCTACAHTW